jgi:hypothetical protein
LVFAVALLTNESAITGPTGANYLTVALWYEYGTKVLKKKPFLVPLGVALAAVFPHSSSAKLADAGLRVGQAQAAITRTADQAAIGPLLALPNGNPTATASGHYSHTSHQSHHSHHSHQSHYSSTAGGHYSHSSHSSHYSST